MRLAGRRIVVTGAASGIGLAIAKLFIVEGAHVVAIDRNPCSADWASGTEQVTADSYLALMADVTDATSIERAIKHGVQCFGGLDGVVNAAGVDLIRPFDEMTSEDWNHVLAVNLTGPAMICRTALGPLKSSGSGTIVNISSGAGLRPLENRAAYCTSKAGIIMLTKALALELAPHNIRANVICPGIIDTPMFRASYERTADPEATLAKIMERFAIKRVGDPTDIAFAALYLSSRESAFVTGSALAVDGGRAFH